MRINFTILFIITIFTACNRQANYHKTYNYSSLQNDSIIKSVKNLIAENYVIKEKIPGLCNSIKKSDFTEIKNKVDFEIKMNELLFKYSNDKHLKIKYDSELASNLISGKTYHDDQAKKEKKDNYGFKTCRILKNNIGYLDLAFFADTKFAKETAIKNLKYLKDTKGLIIDLRNNAGGNGSMLQLLCGVLLEEKKTILDIIYRSGDTVQLITTGAGFQYDKKVCLLVSRNTFSAGEAFAFVLKNQKRAVIFGETTAGAGNIAGPFVIDRDFVLTIPVGIIRDTNTGETWEHIGVAPHYPAPESTCMYSALYFMVK
jgi:hypothetical protein